MLSYGDIGQRPVGWKTGLPEGVFLLPNPIHVIDVRDRAA